ncbi:MAG: pirin family protein [Flavobacteriales bacterium]|nr:pirin family protein [Flavobacteriales bacterium]
MKPLGFQWETQDPFLFCVHHEDFFPKGNDKLGPDDNLDGRRIGNDFEIKDGYRMYHGSTVSGFPGHPHRGFETITVVRKGMVDHTDSLGGAGRYGDGDTQWMTAGKGVQHAEMFPCLNKDEENPMELFQIWLNLPKASKFVEPHYKMLWGETIPKYGHTDLTGKKTMVEIVAGTIENKTAPSPTPNSWAADKNNEVAILNIQMEAGAKWNLPKAATGVNRTIYFFKGDQLKINDTVVKEYHAAEVNANAQITLESGSEKSYVLILQGKPIGEPVVQHGPFVMNTREEIQQAFSDYQQTGFGGWPWPTNDPVHPREKGRFAKHADGTEETKD